MKKARLWIVVASMAAMVGLAMLVSQGSAGEAGGGIKKIAELLKKGDKAGAAKAAAAHAKAHPDLEELMEAFKPAKKKGLGVGAGGDGIEQTLIKIARDAPTAANVGKMADAYAEMGYHIAAIGLVTEAFAPAKDSGKKTKKDWNEWSKGMQEAGLKLAEAGKAKSAADLKTHAAKVNASCNSCHSTFR